MAVPGWLRCGDGQWVKIEALLHIVGRDSVEPWEGSTESRPTRNGETRISHPLWVATPGWRLRRKADFRGSCML
jgi:hypothetical protein